jgi:Protein of unknown function (DUF3089)
MRFKRRALASRPPLLLDAAFRLQGGSVLARRFLWVIAGLVVLVLIGALAWRIFEMQVMRVAMVPTVAFKEEPQPLGPDYTKIAMWIARPDIRNNPSLWVPEGFTTGAKPAAAVFFIHPTSFLQRNRWNAPLRDPESQWRARLFVQSQASAFNGVAEVWAPKYRQATFGAFLTAKKDADLALALAYRDVLAAFDVFLAEIPKDRPIILAGHSQGSLHLTRLLADRIAGKPVAERIAAAYVIGWPISMRLDLPGFGLPGCADPGQAGCILSWQSFAEPPNPKMVTQIYDASVGPNGVSRAGTAMLCVNPITGRVGDRADSSANLGTLVPNDDLTSATLTTGAVPARCDERGFLLIGKDRPNLGPYVLPGNNYHVFDYALFWANIRADAEARLKTFLDE